MKHRQATIYDEGYQQLVARLVACRKARGTTQLELSKKLGMGQYDVSKVENCVRKLDILELRDWLNALDIDHDPLVDTLRQLDV